jgi:protein arginine N-methyltransferase 2
MLLTLLSSKSEAPSSLILKVEDDSALGSTDTFLKSKLRYIRDEHGQEICFLDAGNGEEIGVMMGWEKGLSEPSCSHALDLAFSGMIEKCKKRFITCALRTKA